jgi:hypothetical protein
MKQMTLKNLLLLAMLLFSMGNVLAEEAELKPFVLGFKGAGTVAEL